MTVVVLNNTLGTAVAFLFAKFPLKAAFWKLQRKIHVPLTVPERLKQHTRIAVLMALAATLVAVETNKLTEANQIDSLG